MAVTKCEQGHFYDGEKYDSCPHCKNPLPKRRTFREEFTQYTPPNSQKGAVSHAFTLPGADKGDERTVGVFQTQQGGGPCGGMVGLYARYRAMASLQWSFRGSMHCIVQALWRAVTPQALFTLKVTFSAVKCLPLSTAS